MRSLQSHRNALLTAIAWWAIRRKLHHTRTAGALRTASKVVGIGVALAVVAGAAAWFLRRGPSQPEIPPDGQ